MYFPCIICGKEFHTKDDWDASEIYVEIKGVITKEDLNKIELFSYGDGNSVESIYGGPYIAENPIIIFGKIPEERIRAGYWYKQTVGGPGNYHLEDRYQPPYRYLDFGDRGQETRFYDLVYSDGDDGYFTEPWAKKGGGLVLDYLDDPYVEIIDRELTFEAYRKARQARFEHGEKP